MKRYCALVVLLLAACDTGDVIQLPYHNVAGRYEATVFKEPGELDGGVEIIAAGGMMELDLYPSGTFQWRIVIPPDAESNYAAGSWEYTGRFSLASDTLFFDVNEPVPVVPFREAQWKEAEQEIETFDIPGYRVGFFKIILKRK